MQGEKQCREKRHKIHNYYKPRMWIRKDIRYIIITRRECGLERTCEVREIIEIDKETVNTP